MLLVKTRLGPSTIHGIGVFADEDIPKGTLVWRFNPVIDRTLTDEEIDGLPALAREFIEIYGFYREARALRRLWNVRQPLQHP